MTETIPEDVSRREKIIALLDAARYRPKLFGLLFILGIIVALLEGIGLTFIVPIVELVQTTNPTAEAEGLMAIFATVYQILGIPFTLEFVIVGVAAVMTLRYTSSFLYSWQRYMLRFYYKRHLQKRAFSGVLEARIEYFDEKGSDDILNAIITEADVSSSVVYKSLKVLKVAFLTVTYLLIAILVSPFLTLVSVIILGGTVVLLRSRLDSGYNLGDRVADANKRRQKAAQAGTMGIRDIHIFNLRKEIYENFVNAVDKYTKNKDKIARNLSAIREFNDLIIAVFIFVLIYIALGFTKLSFGELGLFLFAMFRLGPQVSGLNKLYYDIENNLPHLIRTQRFIKEVEQKRERRDGVRSVPDSVETIEFDDVSFSYEEEDIVLRGIDFSVQKGEFIGFVGQSGAGKSTIVSLLAQFYKPDSGRIHANGEPIDEMNPDEWRERLAIVRQSPFIFNDTLRYNLTVGNREATQEEIERACEIAKVDEFLHELPEGYDSRLGDEGVRLSGGQKQRVALARALLKEAEVLVLDEATSDLDSNLEKEVQRAIEEMEREYATIAIAHRLSTVENADRIYTIENGEITECGRHEELLANNGKYSELYAIQSKA